MSYKLGIMKNILKISSVVLLASTFLLVFSSNNVIKNIETKSFTEKVEENSSNMKVGDYALNFKLQNLNGEIVDLFKFVGNIDFVNIFWYNILMKLVIEVIEWLQKI